MTSNRCRIYSRHLLSYISVLVRCEAFYKYSPFTTACKRRQDGFFLYYIYTVRVLLVIYEDTRRF